MQRSWFAIIAISTVGETTETIETANLKAFCVCEGRKSFLDPLEDDFLMWLLELCVTEYYQSTTEDGSLL
jgi:hypothetical protein